MPKKKSKAQSTSEDGRLEGRSLYEVNTWSREAARYPQRRHTPLCACCAAAMLAWLLNEHPSHAACRRLGWRRPRRRYYLASRVHQSQLCARASCFAMQTCEAESRVHSRQAFFICRPRSRKRTTNSRCSCTLTKTQETRCGCQKANRCSHWWYVQRCTTSHGICPCFTSVACVTLPGTHGIRTACSTCDGLTAGSILQTAHGRFQTLQRVFAVLGDPEK